MLQVTISQGSKALAEGLEFFESLSEGVCFC